MADRTRKLAAPFALAALVAGGAASAQTVQIPTPNPAIGPTPGATTFGSPGFAAVNPGPPPVFDSYTGGVAAPATPFGTFGQPTVVAPSQPFGAGPAFGQPAAPPPASSGALFPGGLPVGWEPGTYGFQQGDGSLVRFTRFLQKLDGEYTHLFGASDADDLQLNRVEVTSTFAWPALGSIDRPVLITPGFAANFFDNGGDNLEVFAAFLDAAWFPQLNDWFGGELGVRTGVWTDFEAVNSDSIRLLGRGLAVVRLTPTVEVLAGVVYLDRERIKLLPAGGVRWRPSDDVEFDLIFPNPVVRRRLRSGGVNDWWIFVAGEYGGGSWTTEANPDGFDYNDLRVSIGVEFETPRQITGRLEVGFVFDREFFFPGVGGGVDAVTEFDETVMLRAGINL